ncbi:sensor histidine kinase [Actinomadura kijaniata]|uniref:sensor histidine kinase n=1 Tax=Actinomadura kijaniata TaxID=46161 RepID=UPI00082D212D|nr:HAMP domain-containing sensor histidine kinase [Actinomadura kijaniata]
MSGRGLRWPPSRWSLRARVTAMATAVVAVLMVSGCLAFYLTVRELLYQGLRDRGDRAIAELTQQTQNGATGMLSYGADGFQLRQVMGADGRVVAATPELRGRGPITGIDPPAGGGVLRTRITLPATDEQIYLVARRVSTPDGERVLYAGTVLTDLSRLGTAFVLGLALVTVLGSGVAALLVRQAVCRALRPVGVMRAELASITGGRSGGRVTVPDSADEVAGLAESVNLTLSRLEHVLDRQRAFVGDVSHELRSPLTGLRTQLEVALECPEDEDWPEVARAALNEADRLQRIVGDLLIVARLEAGMPQHREPVDLAELARAELARRRGDRVPIELEAAGGAVVMGSPGQLERVLTNLLDNAVRHAATRARLTVSAEGGQAVVRVADDGTGIDPDHREAVFRRFYRLPEGRRRDGGGTGLGLPISRDIAVAHGGTLEVGEPDPGWRGALLELRIPLSGTDKKRLDH